MSVVIGNIKLDSPVFLAPLAGITDLPFRKVVQRFGAGLVVSEMVASQEMVQNRASTRARAELGLDNARTSVQIAGRDAYWMGECAKLVAGQGARIVDINMGCPAKKVTTGYSGSALMKDPDHALSLIEAVVEAVDVPVTLKMRLGWDDNTINAPFLAKLAEGAGIQMVTIHGRTRCQFYKGQADWKAIKAVKQAVDIPVIVNGDIVSVDSARQALSQSGCDGVMVGRGAQGRPWILSEIAAGIADKAFSAPSHGKICSTILAHYLDIISFYGAELGVRCARKHIGWYLESFSESQDVRSAIMSQTDPDSVVKILEAELPNRTVINTVAA